MEFFVSTPLKNVIFINSYNKQQFVSIYEKKVLTNDNLLIEFIPPAKEIDKHLRTNVEDCVSRQPDPIDPVSSPHVPPSCGVHRSSML